MQHVIVAVLQHGIVYLQHVIVAVLQRVMVCLHNVHLVSFQLLLAGVVCTTAY